MTIILTIAAATTDEAIIAAIRHSDMCAHSLQQRDVAQGAQTVLEYHDVDGIDVLYSPIFAHAYVNTCDFGNSLFIDEIKSAADAVYELRAAAEYEQHLDDTSC